KNDASKENANIVKSKKFTRYPVINKDKDHVIGIINVKDIIHHPLSKNRSLEQYIRPVIMIIETVKIKQLLIRMQKERIHMAILVDEYGGTSGLETVEDILEELVGVLCNEFDRLDEHTSE